MKNLFHLLLATILLFSSVHDVYARGGKKVEKGKVKNVIKLETILPESNAGKDCQFLYILKEDSLNKHSLPDLKLVLSVNLPPGDKGIAIDVGGDCPSTAKAILVRAESDSNDNEEILLSYDENLLLLGTLSLRKDTSGSESDSNDNSDNNNDNNNDGNDHHGDNNGD
ncbi:hypothetical protein HY212_04735 [Candidatus Pacearchaeota archaeon]|nr:hypothetical protein [Candidatus Pacearchaeota archaeon]